MTFLKKFIFLISVLLSAQSFAQFLPDNATLNVQSVQRWMTSNRDFVSVVQVLEPMYKSEEDMKKFEALPASEQDVRIAAFLQKNDLSGVVNPIVARHGWKSVGEYMRLSTRLGNAIAAYFFTQEMSKLTEDQKKALRAKTDTAVLNAPAEDIAFVKSHEVLLKSYIQAYAQGR
ncbi:hypothetical protein GCM10011613_13440 [Cellvibrio zantedeschiae]|uniref:DUF2059 domain-containing protein n=1 Tax=Cellvibrio zantedeschiae TaxID=1237077 RepID=A0ABQ3B0N6_9GAMM|nr:hypothetical protein [Cellvibrio zantedeschiae]GGY70324.1 hypothetical protein GCM10011613_13440 [Cellvibrio zantedeschiae]